MSSPKKKRPRAPTKKAVVKRKAASPPKKKKEKKKASPPKRKAPATKKPTPKASPDAHAALFKALRRHKFSVVKDGDAGDAAHDKAVDAALESFRAHLPAALLEAEGHVFHYYLDCEGQKGDPGYVGIASPKDVWKHVHFGPDATVELRDRDGKIYISLECNCDWEEEHGLQIVLEEGRRIVKVGPFDGHLTNADAYDDPSLEGVVYRAR